MILPLFYSINISAFDYIIDAHGKREVIKSYSISDDEKYLHFILEGTFTDNLGNYGVWDNASTLILQGKNVINFQGYDKSTFQNNEVMYSKGFRNRQEQQARVGQIVVVNASNFLKVLLEMNCTYAVNFYLDNAYFIQKCKITDEQKKVLGSVSKMKE